jgi:hypothetical protein
MRLRTTLSLLPVLTAALVALPTVSVPTAQAAAPAPVAPEVRDLPVDGIDAVVLARSPEPEDEHVDEPAGEEHHELAPVAVTQELATGSFAAVGVTWVPDATLDEVAVQVRTRADGRWGAWTDVEVQLGTGSDPSSREAKGARVGSDLLFVGKSDAVQVRVDSAGGTPRDVRVSLINPGASRADAATTDGTSAETTVLLGGAVAEAAVAAPAYVSRAGWGADESLRRCTPSSSSSLKGGILHTTATSNDYTATQSPAVMRAMYAYHTRSLKWCDIGYNFLVDKFGTLFEGRSGSVTRHVIGSHTGGFNTGTVGVSMIGNHDLVAPTSAALRTVEQVFAWKLGGAGLDPLGTATYTSAGGSATKYAKGTVVTQPMISGHRDYSSKSCPGNLAYPLLDQIRAATAAIIASSPHDPAPAIEAGPPGAIRPVTPPATPAPTGARFVPLAPVRVLDTRVGTGGRKAPVAGGETHDLVLAGAHGIPSGATAVALNLTGTGATAGTHLTVWPSGGVRPDTSVLNLRPGGTAASLVVAGLGGSGATSVRNLAGLGAPRGRRRRLLDPRHRRALPPGRAVAAARHPHEQRGRGCLLRQGDHDAHGHRPQQRPCGSDGRRPQRDGRRTGERRLPDGDAVRCPQRHVERELQGGPDGVEPRRDRDVCRRAHRRPRLTADARSCRPRRLVRTCHRPPWRGLRRQRLPRGRPDPPGRQSLRHRDAPLGLRLAHHP